MIDVKTAVRTATDFLRDLYGEAADVRLEEVELSEHEPFWFVTLSFRENPPLPDRAYKEFKVSVDDGAVRSMRMRVVQ